MNNGKQNYSRLQSAHGSRQVKRCWMSNGKQNYSRPQSAHGSRQVKSGSCAHISCVGLLRPRAGALITICPMLLPLLACSLSLRCFWKFLMYYITQTFSLKNWMIDPEWWHFDYKHLYRVTFFHWIFSFLLLCQFTLVAHQQLCAFRGYMCVNRVLRTFT